MIPLVAAHQFRDDVVPEIFQVVYFPHEKCVVGSELVDQQSDFILVFCFQNMIHKLSKIFIASLPDRRGKPADNQLAFFCQVDA